MIFVAMVNFFKVLCVQAFAYKDLIYKFIFHSYLQNYLLCFKVSDFCVPLAAELSQETPMVVEGVNEDVLRPHLVNKLRVRGVTEGVPEVSYIYAWCRGLIS